MPHQVRWLLAAGEPASGNGYAEWVKSQNGSYHATELERLLSETPKGAVEVSSPAENLKRANWRLAPSLALHVRMNSYDLDSEIHVVERSSRGGPPQLMPIRFVFTNKISDDDKLLLAFDAFVLSKVTKREIGFAKIIHGDDHRALKVKTVILYREVQKRIERAAALLSIRTPPDLVLNRHCGECEFQTRCRQKAIEADDLSLLSGMSEKERKKLHNKGIFTRMQSRGWRWSPDWEWLRPNRLWPKCGSKQQLCVSPHPNRRKTMLNFAAICDFFDAQ